MDINTLIQQLKSEAPSILESFCVVNGSFMKLSDIEEMGYEKFRLAVEENMPLKLYKYFPNKALCKTNENDSKCVNYSIQSLKDNTVFMQSPSLFDDIYDSDINLNFEDYEKSNLIEYCNRCGLNVSESMSTQVIGDTLIKKIVDLYNLNGNLNLLFNNETFDEVKRLSNTYFILKLQEELSKDQDIGKALKRVIVTNFDNYLKYLQNIFRITCFSTSPYSQLMWGGSYADCHKGFCLEYTILPNNESYETIWHNLFPMIYCKVRPDMTKRLVNFEYTDLTIEGLWDIYFHGALRKSLDWAFQNEWRLILPLKSNIIRKDFCVKFFPITKVYLGNRMPVENRNEIIGICKERNIPYVGVARKSSVYEMKEYKID